MVAMLDYLLKGSGQKVEDFPGLDPSALAGDLSKTPKMDQAPPFIKDALIFPYFGGMTFSAAIIKPSGWSGLSAVFAKPPLSTQQIMHPALYRSGKTPAVVKISSLEKLLGTDWEKLDENAMGEFGWKEVLKQFIGGEDKAKPIAAWWEGDRYVLYEQKQSKKLVLVARLELDSEEHATRFFNEYSTALQKKYPEQTNPSRLPNFSSFETPDGGVFLRCVGVECITVEGTSRKTFDGINQQIGWPPTPPPANESASRQVSAYQLRIPSPRAAVSAPF